MVYFASECFSGECGFCHSCCSNEQEEKDKKPGNYELAIDMKKFYGKRIIELTDEYWSRMIRDTLKVGYRNPEDNGHIRRKIVIDEKSKFELYEKNPHNLCCHTPLCLAIYENAHDYEKKHKYSVLPIYVNKATNKKQCYLCLAQFNN